MKGLGLSISAVAALSLLTPVAASAQRVEASVGAGFTASEGITLDNEPLLGQVYDTLGLDSGGSFNVTFGVFVSEHAELEFLLARQSSQLFADGPSGKLPLSDLAIANYHFNFVYNFGGEDARVRPFVLAGLGATNYAFGDNLLGNNGSIDNDTKFSTTFGGGVKFYFLPNVGVKAMARWTPTYIRSDAAGVWCDPFYGCWPVVDNDYANQFETSAGITFRF